MTITMIQCRGTQAWLDSSDFEKKGNRMQLRKVQQGMIRDIG